MNIRLFTSVILIFQLTWGMPAVAFAQETGPTQPTGPTEPTGATECTGASCHQGEGQGDNQGFDQGANQGVDQGVDQNLDLSNENTGENSTNTNQASTTKDTSSTTSNTAHDTTDLTGDAQTGNNTNSQNTGNAGVTSGNANIGVTQVKSDNTTVQNGDVVFSNTAHDGTITGDLVVGSGTASSLQNSDGSVKSIKATNSSTGTNSDNSIIVNTNVSEVTEVQNDGTIENTVAALANTGGNHADQNSGDASITTGDANVAASLVNLLNTTVENGNIVITTEDVYGDVIGNIRIPDFQQLSTLLTGSRGGTSIVATNTNTGAGSQNSIDYTKTTTDTMRVDSNAQVDTTITTNAITGQNDSLENTGESSIETGDANVQGGNVTLANTTVKDASLGVVIINALNRFIGFLIGSDNSPTPLSEDETLAYVQANNSNTGANSDNSVQSTDTSSSTTTVRNDAHITNSVSASAITGQNTTNKNTGTGKITTGDANITATAVNVANTTVKNGNLAVYIVNVFGNFFGDVLWGNTHLALPHDTSKKVEVDAVNENTGADSTNTVAVHVTNSEDTTVDNTANVRTVMDTTIDTGNNHASKNTNGATIETGEGNLHLFTSTLANTVALGRSGGTEEVSVNSNNTSTGANSENHTTVDVTDNFSATIQNIANVETIIPGSVNTGMNEMNQNTVGGTIATGKIGFGLNINAILNRILLAFGDPTINATSENTLTGNNSNNSNSVSFARNLLLSIFNQAVVDSIINLLLNTGGNTANDNTLAAAIQTGPICGDVNVHNNANTLSGMGDGIAATIINTANAATLGSIAAVTGNNTANQNTAGSNGGTSQNCPPAPTAPPTAPTTPTPTPGPTGGGGTTTDTNGGGGQGGGDTGGDDQGGDVASDSAEKPAIPRVAGVITNVLRGVGALGFGTTPVLHSHSSRNFPLIPFAFGSTLALTSAAWADRRAQYRKKLYPI